MPNETAGASPPEPVRVHARLAREEPGGTFAAERPAAWRVLEGEGPEPAWLEAWLDVLAHAGGHLVAAAAFDGASGGVLAAWPRREDVPAPAAELAAAAAVAGKPLSRRIPAGAADLQCVACPVSGEGPALVVALVARAGASPAVLLRRAAWGAAWIKARRAQDALGRASALLDRSRMALDAIAAAAEQAGFAGACTAAATVLARLGRCERVAVGFMRGDSARVDGLSDAARAGERVHVVRRLEAAMEEAVEQRMALRWPVPEGQVAIAQAQGELAHATRAAGVMTIPALVGEGRALAFVFERSSGAFDAAEAETFETVAAFVGPVLDEKRLNDRPLVVKAAVALADEARRLLGPAHAGRKAIILAALAAAAFLSLDTEVYRVSGAAQIEGLQRRSVVAPYDGFVREAPVRAGDTVQAGDLLAAFEDRDLVLERLRWSTERQQRSFEYERALASRQPAAINVLRAQIEQAEAQLKLVDEQMARVKMRAPIDGLVVSGDLSQVVGGAVSRGQVLFEIAPLEGWRVVVQVSDRDIGEVASGQEGLVLLGAMPSEPLRFRVDAIVPIAEAKGGRNAFRVEGRVLAASPRLRPGMEGVAKIDVDRRPVGLAWFGPLLSALRLWLWQWAP